jgi:hypothetical protein
MDFNTVFGFSLALENGDLVINDAGQLQQVSGRENLLQALQLRVQTPFGSDRFNVNYGLDMTATFTQAQPLNLVKQLIQLDVVRSLGTDPRVREIQEVIFSDDSTYLARHPDIPLQTLQARRAVRLWDVEATVITADGSTATLALTLGGRS